MKFIFSASGIIAAVSFFALTILDIMQKHLGVDTQGMLLGMGGAFGNGLADISLWFGEKITSIAAMIDQSDQQQLNPSQRSEAITQLIAFILTGAVAAFVNGFMRGYRRNRG